MNELFQGKLFVEDKRAKSLSFFSTQEVAWVDDNWIEQLRQLSAGEPKRNARLCLHQSHTDPFHEMVILQHRGGYYRPHKHRRKGESLHIMEGRAGVFLFNDEGNVERTLWLGEAENRICRIGPSRWHTVIPLSDYVIYHEAKPGPFEGVDDSIFPVWAPDGSDSTAAGIYLQQLIDAAPKRGAGQ